MKKVALMLSLVLSGSYVGAVQHHGNITEEVDLGGGAIQQNTMYWVCEDIDYVSGGITCTFPSGLFASAPKVLVSVRPDAYSAGVAYVAEVVSISTSSCTVRVNVVTDSGLTTDVAEAGTSDVVVHFWVIGSPL